nr:hypothetical protein [Tanacetum cinerariifolium]
MNQNFLKPNPFYEPNSSSFVQYQPLQSFVTQQLPQRSNKDIRLEMAKLIKNNQILLNNNIFLHEEAKLLPQLLNDSRTIDEMLKQREQAANLAVQKAQEELAEYIDSPSWNHPTFYNNDEEHSIQYNEYLKNSSNAITTVLPTEEPKYSLSMGDDDSLHNEDVPMENRYILLKSSLFDSSPKLIISRSSLVNLCLQTLLMKSVLRESTENISVLWRSIESDDYDSEGDIRFLEELLNNDSISLLENESSNFDHHDDQSFPLPPPEPPDVEFFLILSPIQEN